MHYAYLRFLNGDMATDKLARIGKYCNTNNITIDITKTQIEGMKKEGHPASRLLELLKYLKENDTLILIKEDSEQNIYRVNLKDYIINQLQDIKINIVTI